MARPKAKKPKPAQPNAMSIRAPQAWLDWLDGFRAKKLHNVDRTKAIDIALETLAEKHGYPRPPARY